MPVIEDQKFCGLSITHRWHRLPIDAIDYSLMTHQSLIDYYTGHERHFSCFLVPFAFVCDSFICVRRIFSCIWSSCWRCGETQSANHTYRWLSIVQYFTSPNSLFDNKTTEEQRTSLKMKLTSTLRRIHYVVIDFLGRGRGVFVSKVKLLWLRETSVITSLSIEYLYEFQFFGLWANGWKSMTNQCNLWLIDDQTFCGLSISYRLLINPRQ